MFFGALLVIHMHFTSVCYSCCMETKYVSMADLIANMKLQPESQEDVEVSKYKTNRNELFAQLHEFYLMDKKNTDKLAYAKWLFRNKLKPCPDNIERWKKTSGEYRQPITPKSLASFWLAHIPTADLYYLLSIARDMEKRKQSFNKWLFWAIK